MLAYFACLLDLFLSLSGFNAFPAAAAPAPAVASFLPCVYHRLLCQVDIYKGCVRDSCFCCASCKEECACMCRQPKTMRCFVCACFCCVARWRVTYPPPPLLRHLSPPPPLQARSLFNSYLLTYVHQFFGFYFFGSAPIVDLCLSSVSCNPAAPAHVCACTYCI
jgi:hypothetical protein